MSFFALVRVDTFYSLTVFFKDRSSESLTAAIKKL